MKDRDPVELADLPCFGRPTRLVWHKVRLACRPDRWKQAVAFGVLDLSGPYRKTFDETLPEATQAADPFHVAKLANQKLDECRRRVQNETLGHRGRKDVRSIGRKGC